MKYNLVNSSNKPTLKSSGLFFLILNALSLTASLSLNGQIHFQSNEPIFSFDLPVDWKPSHRPPTYPMIGKYVKIDEKDVIIGNFKVSKELQEKVAILDIWNLNEETQKKEIIHRVTDNGEKVSELSKEYGVVAKTIYKLLGRKANQSSAVLELSKLRRENEALLSIIGSLVAESKLGKKKR